MKRLLFAAALAAATVPATAADVGVSISVGQPGFYGRIDIGQFPHPAVIYPEPVIVQPAPIGAIRRPIYLRVPPGHAKDWRRYCQRYNACGQPVYFVQERWYDEVYAPRYREARRPAYRPGEPRHYDRRERPGAPRHEPPRRHRD
ncbi:MAG: hypothetical protein M9907_10680 [Burkholderiaceae bacterium]|nr:hypothetical protein [Burkholderiaceae bacterium]